MASVSPYELRLELLKLATDHCRDQYFWAKETAERELDILRGDGQKSPKTLAAVQFPQPYSLEDVIKTAEKLRGFIDSKTGGININPVAAQLLSE